MRILQIICYAVALLVGFGAFAAPASAQATRTWVSGVGDDVNPCSRTAPCKTFAGAVSKTAAGGEINCLDPGGYGAVTITKSLTISCPYTEGGALASGNGITVNDSATATPGTAVVYLRGLDIFGVSPPTHGVRFVSGASLSIEDSVIRRFNSSGSFGVSFAPAHASKLFINNVTISENGSGATGGGIEIRPTGTGTAKALITNTRVHNNANNGVRIDSTGTTTAPGNTVTIENSQIAGNGNGISVQTGTVSTVMVAHNSVVNNSGTGIVAAGASSSVMLGNNSITGNAAGISASGGSELYTFTNNRLEGNPSFSAPVNGAPTSTLTPK